jgi:hypothetical protein
MRHLDSITGVVVLALVGLCAVSARAQTPTVTPTGTAAASPTATLVCTPPSAAQPCLGNRKLNLTWSAKDPLEAILNISATNCPAPPRCGGAQTPITVQPLTLTITDAASHSLAKTITIPSVIKGSCPSGSDTYRTPFDRLRIVYGKTTTVVGKLRMPLAQPTPPTFTGSLSFTLRDSCGYVIDGATSTCFPRVSAHGTAIKCF